MDNKVRRTESLKTIFPTTTSSVKSSIPYAWNTEKAY